MRLGGIFFGLYDVMVTDYDNYAVVHSCTKFLGIKHEDAWVLTRKPLTKDDFEGQQYLQYARAILETIEGFDFDEQMFYTY